MLVQLNSIQFNFIKVSNHNKLSQDTLHVEQKPDKAHPEQASNFATVVTKNSQW